MTVLEALAQANCLRPNELDDAVKLAWLSALDGQICAELLAAYEGETVPFSGYGPETELRTTSLLVPWPYDELYLRYLVMRLDLEHGELDRYNNSAAAFNRLWQSYASHYHRTHSPKGAARLIF